MNKEDQIKERLKTAQQQQMQMQMDLEKADTLRCESKVVDLAHGIEKDCGGEIFGTGVELKRLSALVSPNGQTSVVPVQIFYCTKCHSRFNLEDVK